MADDKIVAVWDYWLRRWIPHYACPGEQRVRVDYHGSLDNLAVFEVTIAEDGLITPVNPNQRLADWRIDLS